MKKCLENPVHFPEHFDHERFISGLRAYIKVMHDEYRIHHRDLHSGNIMIDRETGDARVIDFGKSKHFIMEPSEQVGFYRETDAWGTVNVFLIDEQKINEYERRLFDIFSKTR